MERGQAAAWTASPPAAAAVLLDAADAAAAALRQQLGWGQRSGLVLLAATLSAVYLSLVVRRLGVGRPAAFAALLPLAAFNCWLPLLFDRQDELLSRANWLLLLMWLGTWKALGMVCNRGPLAGPWTTGQMAALYVLPIYPSSLLEGDDDDDGGGEDEGRHENGSGEQQQAGSKTRPPVKKKKKKGRLSDSSGGAHQVARSLAANTLMLALVAYLTVAVPLPAILRHYLYGLGLAALLTFLLDGPAALLLSVLDLAVVPPFDKPWLSTSLADFWSRRWNNTVSLTLRALVYDPIVERRLVAPRPPRHAYGVRAVAALAAAAADEKQQGGGGGGGGGPRPAAHVVADASAVVTSPAQQLRQRQQQHQQQQQAHHNGSNTAAAAVDPKAAPRNDNHPNHNHQNPNHLNHHRVPLALKVLGMSSTFAASGLMHEWILYYLVAPGAFRPGFWMAFFVVQVPLLLLEDRVRRRRRAAARRRQAAAAAAAEAAAPPLLEMQQRQRKARPLAALAGVAWTMGALLLTAYAFFFPPVESHSDIAQRAAAAVTDTVAGLLGAGAAAAGAARPLLASLVDGVAAARGPLAAAAATTLSSGGGSA